MNATSQLDLTIGQAITIDHARQALERVSNDPDKDPVNLAWHVGALGHHVSALLTLVGQLTSSTMTPSSP